MTRTARTLHVEALDALLRGRMAEVAVARDWELLREIARLAQQDAPQDRRRPIRPCFRRGGKRSPNIT